MFFNQNKEKKDTKKKKSKSSGFAFALWLLGALFLLVVFLLNQNKIFNNLKETGFFDRIGQKTPTFVENAESPKTKEPVKNDVQPLAPVEINLTGDYTSERTVSKEYSQSRQTVSEPKISEPVITETPVIKEKSVTAKSEEAKKQELAKTQSESKPEQKKIQPVEKKETVVKKETTVTAPVKQQMKLKLYFMAINSNGSVTRREVTREMKKSDSPLVDAINALITGPNAAEENSGCRSLVSDGTRLIGASVKNGVAFLNFSQDFEYNQYGIEGTRGQLQQIVYTATAFPTVESVQFLIDGDKREYLGSEGVWIGTPLNRNSF